MSARGVAKQENSEYGWKLFSENNGLTNFRYCTEC